MNDILDKAARLGFRLAPLQWNTGTPANPETGWTAKTLVGLYVILNGNWLGPQPTNDGWHSYPDDDAAKVAVAGDVARRLFAAMEFNDVPFPPAYGWETLPVDDQYELARRIAANCGYVLAPEPSIQDAEDFDADLSEAALQLARLPGSFIAMPLDDGAGMFSVRVDVLKRAVQAARAAGVDQRPRVVLSGYRVIPPGADVRKPKGYPFPGQVRAAFLNRAGELRYVVEATGAGYAGMLHIYSPGQIEAAP